MTKRERWIVALAILAVVAAATPWMFPMVWRTAVAPAEISAPARGRLLAESLGCFSCHGPGGVGGVPDPGSTDPVPAFTGGVPWEFADNTDELRNWILWGDAKGKKSAGLDRARGTTLAMVVPILAHGSKKHEDATPTSATTATAAATPQPDAHAHEHAGVMKMPPFRNHVTDAQADDLVAYVVALSPKEPPPDEAVRRGLEIARRNGCFACHGPMGSGGISNPGSFKGYIPGFSGTDLRELAKDRAEVEAWIRDGNITRLSRNPAAAFFLDRQPIKMPPFEKQLRETEIDDLVAAVEWIHAESTRIRSR